MPHYDPPRYVRDPGQSTWREALDGAAEERDIAADRIRKGMDSIASLLPADRHAASSRDVGMSDWKHWNDYHKRWSAYLRIHPEQGDKPMRVDCKHPIVGTAPACWVGVDRGYYIEPSNRQGTLDSPSAREPGEEG